MGKFGPKKSKFFVLSENWRGWYLEDTGSYFQMKFQNLDLVLGRARPTKKKYLFRLIKLHRYHAGADLFHLKSVTGENSKERC